MHVAFSSHAKKTREKKIQKRNTPDARKGRAGHAMKTTQRDIPALGKKNPKGKEEKKKMRADKRGASWRGGAGSMTLFFGLFSLAGACRAPFFSCCAAPRARDNNSDDSLSARRLGVLVPTPYPFDHHKKGQKQKKIKDATVVTTSFQGRKGYWKKYEEMGTVVHYAPCAPPPKRYLGCGPSAGFSVEVGRSFFVKEKTKSGPRARHLSSPQQRHARIYLGRQARKKEGAIIQNMQPQTAFCGRCCGPWSLPRVCCVCFVFSSSCCLGARTRQKTMATARTMAIITESEKKTSSTKKIWKKPGVTGATS